MRSYSEMAIAVGNGTRGFVWQCMQLIAWTMLIVFN